MVLKTWGFGRKITFRKGHGNETFCNNQQNFFEDYNAQKTSRHVDFVMQNVKKIAMVITVILKKNAVGFGFGEECNYGKYYHKKYKD